MFSKENYKTLQYKICYLIGIIYWVISFFTDRKIFSKDPLNMNCLPIDIEMTSFFHMLTKVIVYLNVS